MPTAFDEPMAGRTIVAQDILADRALDITGQVILDVNKLTIPGELIDRLGLANATAGDKSKPGLAMVISSLAKGVAPAGSNR